MTVDPPRAHNAASDISTSQQRTGVTIPSTRDRASLLADLRSLDSCAVSDALDTLGLTGAVAGIRPMWDVRRVVAGVARTVAVTPRSVGGPSAHVATSLVSVTDPDDVIVIDNRGRTDVSSWGGLLAQAAVVRGVAGVIVDGACRDISENEDLGLPLFSRAVVPVSARGRIVQKAMDVPVQVGVVTVEPGDLVIADGNGIAFIPRGKAETVLALAARIVEREAAMGNAVRSGRDVVEVMHDSQFPTVEKSSDR